MCGIFGFCGVADTDGDLLERMGKMLVHRGPDGVGYYKDVEAKTYFGHRRLSIIDLKGGKQPLSNEDNSVWLICNGEIYNFIELREELEKKGHWFKTRSDAEVLVHLYEEHGDNFLEETNGMFGLALYDLKTRKVLLARDRQGIKPLYYACVNNALYFSSEIKPLFESPDVPREPEWKGICSYLELLYIPSPSCGFKNIQKLPSGQMLIYKDSSAELKRYWDITRPLSLGNSFSSREEAQERLLELLEDSAD